MKFNTKLSAIAISITLAACGGGGGGSSSGSTGSVPPVQNPPVVTPPVVVAPTSDLQTSIAAATYAPGSQQLAFFTAYNDFRSKLGLGLLAQNTKLDTATENHLKYLATNTDVNFSAVDPVSGRPYFHLEDAARPNFTGVTEADRARFAQYAGSYVGELGGYGNGKGAVSALNDLIATVYHRAGLMFQFPREIGIAVGTDVFQTFVVNFGYSSARQFNASNYFGAYPADQQTNVPRVMYIETPNPLPDVAYADYGTKTSYPINVVSESATTLSVTSFTVTEAGQSAPLDARIMTKDNDPNKMLTANTAFLIGKAPFKANTTYQVRFEGTVNGAAMVKTWSFTTGA
ncbi:CAP domain-containing protein [Agrobacterium tumefaciens]|uniref:CAP domain-containing protein n=1 Tax=Agrobacterium tumefaciens TaxID=358 RepID=UPI001574A3FC|nr:CAP domain-containing protein [Agrobacterium tumefaciens]NTB05930.1 CAP domain-containing protein [Agrobacterium tumefaciens]